MKPSGVSIACGPIRSGRARTQKQERTAAYARLRQRYLFSEYALQEFAKHANCTWIADHIDSMMAQTLATRAYRAANRVCLGQAKKVRFKSHARGLHSVENKWSKSGMRFVLKTAEEGKDGCLVWGMDCLRTLIDRHDPVVKHGLSHRIKYARLLRRKATSPKARGADSLGYRYYVQLVIEGKPYQKPNHIPGTDVIGLDLGPSSATRSRIQNCFILLNRSSEAYCSTSSTPELRSGEVTSRYRSPLTTFLGLRTAHRTVRRNECLLASKRIRSQGEWHGQPM